MVPSIGALLQSPYTRQELLIDSVSHVCALAARELKEGCSDARLSETANVFLHLLMNIVIHSAVVNILMHCVSKIYEPAGVYISHYDRCCQITFH